MAALSKKPYDAIYINYDTINTYVNENCLGVFQDLRNYCLSINIPCYILKASSFEALLLQSRVIADLMKCIKDNKYIVTPALLETVRDIYLISFL